MKSKTKVSMLMLLFLSLTINGVGCASKPAVRDISDSLLDNITYFSVQSGGQVLSSSSKNEIYSPLGLYSVLNMMTVLTDEDSDSYLELSEALQTDKSGIEDNFKVLTKDITDSLKKSKVTNSLWFDNKDDVYNKSYLEDETKKLGASLKEIDFALEGPSKFAGFIKDATSGLINPNPSDFEWMRTQNFALLNTLYYDGQWEKEFDGNRFVEFIDDQGQTLSYKSIRKEEQVYAYKDNRISSIRMNYKDGAYMIMFKPEIVPGEFKVESLNDILSDYDYLGRIIKHYQDEESLSFREIKIEIPKFKTTSKFSLNEHIKDDLNIPSIYNFGKDFSPMLNEGNDFMMTTVEQMSYIEVDEKGTKVASATFSFGCGGMAPEPNFFTVDRPTGYIIMSETDIPLFMGTIRSV